MDDLLDLDRRIDALEGDALRDRWEFGRLMLAARDGAGRLPNGYLSALVDKTGKSRSELKYRAIFASQCPTEAELVTAVTSYQSWTDLRSALKATTDNEDNQPVGPPPTPEGKYATFVADPPWRYGNTSTRGAAENHYPTMSIDELCDLTVVPDHAADQSHLYLWTTAGHLPDAFSVMRAWGFDYKSYLVWVKPQMGMGNYFRVSTELVLFGVRGNIRTARRDVKNYFEARRAKHSAKPTQFHDIVASCSPGPYMELFSRCTADRVLVCECSKCRLGWTVWGNQA